MYKVLSLVFSLCSLSIYGQTVYLDTALYNKQNQPVAAPFTKHKKGFLYFEIPYTAHNKSDSNKLLYIERIKTDSGFLKVTSKIYEFVNGGLHYKYFFSKSLKGDDFLLFFVSNKANVIYMVDWEKKYKVKKAIREICNCGG